MNDLENEIDKLNYELSVVIPEELHTALMVGDSADNAEYSEIISRYYLMNIRLHQLIKRLNTYNSINLENISRDKIGIGSIVTVEQIDTNTKICFKIVLSEISDDIATQYTEVTANSPIGKALRGHAINETVTIKLPIGKVKYKILNIVTLHDLEK
jgi:transcription elongation factor GreA